LPQVFERRDRAADQVVAYEQQVEELYTEIGRLTTQVAWLKKIWPRAHGRSDWLWSTALILRCR